MRDYVDTNTNNKKDALVKVKFFEKQFDILSMVEEIKNTKLSSRNKLSFATNNSFLASLV